MVKRYSRQDIALDTLINYLHGVNGGKRGGWSFRTEPGNGKHDYSARREGLTVGDNWREAQRKNGK